MFVSKINLEELDNLHMKSSVCSEMGFCFVSLKNRNLYSTFPRYTSNVSRVSHVVSRLYTCFASIAPDNFDNSLNMPQTPVTRSRKEPR